MKKPDIEKILSVNPDFVIASSATDSQITMELIIVQPLMKRVIL